MELIKFNIMAIGDIDNIATKEYMDESFDTGETFVVYINPMQIICISHFYTWKGDENTSDEYPIYITNKDYTQLTYKKNWAQHFKEMPNMFSDKRYKVWYGHCY